MAKTERIHHQQAYNTRNSKNSFSGRKKIISEGNMEIQEGMQNNDKVNIKVTLSTEYIKYF